MRKLLLASLLALATLAIGHGAHAATCPVPNPNALAGDGVHPFYDGCDLPAVALNRLVTNPIVGTELTGIDDGGPVFLTESASSVPSSQYIWSAVNQAVAGTGYPPAPVYDVNRCVMVANSGGTTNIASCYGSYVINDVTRTSPTYAGQTTYNYIGEGVLNADGAAHWGINLLCTDSLGQTIATHNPRFCYNEIDYNFNSVNSQGVGMQVGGASTVQPASALGYTCNRLDGYPGTGTIAHWTACFETSDGSTPIALYAGASSTAGTHIASSSVNFNGYTNSSTPIAAALQLDGYSNMLINAPAAGTVTQEAGGTTIAVAEAGLFQVGGTTTAPTHLAATQATSPVATSCGTTPTVQLGSSDTAGTVEMGSSATGCIITFNHAYSNNPSCVVTWRATPLASQSYTVSTAAITLTQTSTTNNYVDYMCMVRGGG